MKQDGLRREGIETQIVLVVFVFLLIAGGLSAAAWLTRSGNVTAPPPGSLAAPPPAANAAPPSTSAPPPLK